VLYLVSKVTGSQRRHQLKGEPGPTIFYDIVWYTGRCVRGCSYGWRHLTFYAFEAAEDGAESLHCSRHRVAVLIETHFNELTKNLFSCEIDSAGCGLQVQLAGCRCQKNVTSGSSRPVVSQTRSAEALSLTIMASRKKRCSKTRVVRNRSMRNGNECVL
jgi:hypothetical protein